MRAPSAGHHLVGAGVPFYNLDAATAKGGVGARTAGCGRL